MQQKIDSLTGKTVNITTSGGGASSASAAAYTPSVAYAAPVGIPYLATGAVIPPNAPFMAVLGDQKNGTNIEAPEGLLRKIVRDEIGNIEIVSRLEISGEMEPLIRLMYPEFETEARRKGKSLASEIMNY